MFNTSFNFCNYKIDERLEEESKNYDSRYLAQARNLENKKGVLEGKINTLKRLLPMTEKVKKLENKPHELSKKLNH